MIGVGNCVNGGLDFAPPTLHQVVVAGKRTKQTKNGTKYYVTVPAWREGVQRERLRGRAARHGHGTQNDCRAHVVDPSAPSAEDL